MALTVGVIGATSPVGSHILRKLAARGDRVIAYSRKPHDGRVPWEWRVLSAPAGDSAPAESIPYWIFVAQIWLLPDYFALLEHHRAQRLVAISSTSLFTKTDSTEIRDRELSRRLENAEAGIATWAEQRGIAWTVLRPTMIYGGGRDNNVTAVARFARRFGFFPLLGEARGLRQPIHSEDVAQACIAALEAPAAKNQAYNISGAEILNYREMVGRIFAAMGRPPRMPKIPMAAIKAGISLLRLLPRFRRISPAMAERMNKDMIFDHEQASRDFGFAPRRFDLSPVDVTEPASRRMKRDAE